MWELWHERGPQAFAGVDERVDENYPLQDREGFNALHG